MALFPVRILIGCTVLTAIGAPGSDTVSAQIGERKTIWGMKNGDAFTASVIVRKQTETTVGNQAPTISESTDKYQIQYRVVGTSPANELMISARLFRPVRDTEDSSPDVLKAAQGAMKSLEDLTMFLEVSPAGEVTNISSADREEIVAYFSGLDSSATKLLSDACTDDVIASWFARPFWLASDPAGNTKEAAWNRTDEIALGSFGTLRCDAELKAEKVGTTSVPVGITGKGRFIPLVLPSAEPKSGDRLLTDVTAELDEFTGTGQMLLTSVSEEQTPPDRNRPQFESLDVTIRFHGTGTLAAKKNDPSSASPPVTVSFRQTQMQSWFLQGFSFGRPEFFFNGRTPAPKQ